MLTRSNRELLRKGKGAFFNAPAWSLVSTDLTPCDPADNLTGVSESWFEQNHDLNIFEFPSTGSIWEFVDNGDDSDLILIASVQEVFIIVEPFLVDQLIRPVEDLTTTHIIDPVSLVEYDVTP